MSGAAAAGIPESSKIHSKSADADFVTQSRKVAAACLTTFGTGAAQAFYLAGVGFYVIRFSSNLFLIWMLLALFTPFPVALFLQERFDALFDKAFSTRVTFFFRVILLPLGVAAILAVLALVCTFWTWVLVCGVALGFCCAASTGSSLQMTAAWEPILIIWAQIGSTTGSLTATLTFFLFSFTASKASILEFQVILLVPVAICCLTSGSLMYLHFRYDLFEHVYRRLAYDLPKDPEDFPEDFPALMPLVRGSSATAPIYGEEDVDSLGVPLWVPWYNQIAGVNLFLSFLVLPFATFLGDPDMAQTLVLAKFAMDSLGQLLALAWAHFHEDEPHKPIHVQVGLQFFSRILIGIVLLLHLFKNLVIPQTTFLTLWCYFFLDEKYLLSQIGVLSTHCTVIAQRKAVARKKAFLTSAGMLIGLVCALVLAHLMNPSSFHHKAGA